MRLTKSWGYGLLLLGIAGGIAIVFTTTNPDHPPATINQEMSLTAPAEKIYVVREFEGKVAAFEKGQLAPLQTTDVLVSTLPKQDQADLRMGITVSSKAELVRLLEDLCS